VNNKSLLSAFLAVILVCGLILVGATRFGTAQSSGSDSWPMFHNDLAHSGYSESAGPLANQTLWKYQAGSGIESSPAVVDGVVYFGVLWNGHNGLVNALDAATGSKIWQFATDSGVESSPAVVDGVVYIGSYSGQVYALDAATGSKIWSFNAGGSVFPSPAVADGKVYVGSASGDMYALDAADGLPLWKYRTGGAISSSPAVVDGVVYVGSQDQNMYALRANDGLVIWNYTTGSFVDTSPAVVGGIVYFGSRDGYVYALDAATGSKIWSFSPSNGNYECYYYSTPAVANGVVYVGGYDNYVSALNATNGNVLWEFPTGGYIFSSPVVAGGVVYVGSFDGNVYALNAVTGSKIWSYQTGDQMRSSAAVANGVVYVGSGDGYLYAFKSNTVNSPLTPSPSPSPSASPSPTTPKTEGEKTSFYDNFDDGVADGWTPQAGSWRVINGEYFISVGIVENGITTVNGLNLKDCTIETKLRFTDDFGYRAGIVFRYMGKDTYYELEVSNEYDCLGFSKYLPECPDYGTQNYGFGERTPAEIHFATGELKAGGKVTGSVPLATISKNVEYTLRVTITGNTFVGELIGGGIDQKIVWEDTDNPFTYGTVGLRARRADAYFDNFRVFNATVAPSPTPTPTPSPAPMLTQSLQSYSDDFSTDSGAWQYLGSAYRNQTNQHLVLTTSSNDQKGVAFFRTPVQGAFTASFNYKGIGDGFLFFFYKQEYPSSIDWEESYGDNGVAGGRLGFNTQSIIPGYGIEFDGWANIASEFADIVGGKPNPSADPSDSHIALIKDFTGNHLAYVNDQRIYDNAWHQVSIDVQESSVAVYFDQELVLQWNGVFDRTYGGLGFSGSNGQVEASWHLIDNFSITARNVQKPSLSVSCRSSTSYSGFNVQIDGYLTLNETGISGAPILLSYSVTGGKSWEDLTLVYTGSDGSYSATWLPSVTGNYLIKATYEGDTDTLGTSSEIVNFAVTNFAEKNLLFSVSSNSTVTSLAFNSTTSELSFTVSGPSETTGYVKVAIAKSLVSNAENIKVYLDGNQLNYEVTSNEDSWLLTFTYKHSTHQVMISLATNAGGVAFLSIEPWVWIASTIVIGTLFTVGTAFMHRRRGFQGTGLTAQNQKG
jgi:outer membrane protein assembly factor BamB